MTLCAEDRVHPFPEEGIKESRWVSRGEAEENTNASLVQGKIAWQT
jgi:hypothetical protein